MIGLEQIFAAQTLLAGYTVKCEMKTAPQINVTASGLETVIDDTKSITELDTFKPMIATPSPYGKGVQTHVEGLMHGEINVTGGYMFNTETYAALNKVCLYVAHVDVKISVDPTIYIAREYPKGSCQYNAVLEHEKKHVRTDREIINKYTNIIVKAVNNTLKKIGYGHGPYDVAQLPALQKQISGIIESVIGQFSANMNKERQLLQSKVDSLEEYNRVDALCADKPRLKF